MEGFSYYNPTRVVFGKGSEVKAAEELLRLKAGRVLLHYGSKSAVESGLIGRIKKCLDDAGLFYVELGGVQPNPRVSKVREGIALSRENNVDAILAVGGGSVIDSAKAISVGVGYDGDVWDFFAGKARPESSMTVGVVLTIAAAGSETSDSCVINNDDGLLKRSCNGEFMRPAFALMNPELTYSLPPYQVACGIVDIMMHTLDRYFNPNGGNDFVDRMSEALLQSVIRSGADSLADPYDYTARANLMWAGSVSHSGLTGVGKKTDFAVHHMEHELSALYDVAHGAGLAAIWSSWARYVMSENVMRFCRYAVKVWNLEMDYEHPERTAREGIMATESYFRSLGMPVRISGLGLTLTADELHKLSEKATFFGKRTLGAFKSLSYTDIRTIFTMAQ